MRYLAEIAETVRGYHRLIDAQARIARERQSLKTAKALFESAGKPAAGFDELIAIKTRRAHARAAAKLLEQWPKTRELYAQDEYVVKIRDKEIRTRLNSRVAVGHQDPQSGAAALRG